MVDEVTSVLRAERDRRSRVASVIPYARTDIGEDKRMRRERRPQRKTWAARTGRQKVDRNSRRHVRLVRRRILAAVDGCLRLAELLVGRCVGDAALEAIHVVVGGAAAGIEVSKGTGIKRENEEKSRLAYPLGVQSH